MMWFVIQELTNEYLIDTIGNLTLLEGKNSNNGHVGNFSLGSKDFEKKTQSYKDSSCLLTRTITNNYEKFFQ